MLIKIYTRFCCSLSNCFTIEIFTCLFLVAMIMSSSIWVFRAKCGKTLWTAYSWMNKLQSHSMQICVLPVWSPDTASSSVQTPFSSGASANESSSQECCHGDEGGLLEAAWADLSQDLHPTSWQCQVRGCHDNCGPQRCAVGGMGVFWSRCHLTIPLTNSICYCPNQKVKNCNCSFINK